MIIRYTVLEDDPEMTMRRGPLRFTHRDLKRAAEKCAEHYHNRHSFEARWPLTFAIMNNSGEELARYDVERIVHPLFSAELIG